MSLHQQDILNDKENVTVVFPSPEKTLDADLAQSQLAWHDYKNGLAKWRIWTMLAYQDIQVRYRRSILGPFWLTLSMAITVYSMGYLYAELFRIDLTTYYPFLVAGMLSWTLLSANLMDATDGLVVAESFIKQVKLPYTLYMHRIAYRNLIIFFHNVVVMIPIFFIFHETAKINFNTLLLIPALFFVYINTVTYGLAISMLSARYRDISQIIKSLLQVIFFITPVMWNPKVLSEQKKILVSLNPFYHFIEIIRKPLLGEVPTIHNGMVVLFFTIIGLLASFYLLIKYRARIVYWL